MRYDYLKNSIRYHAPCTIRTLPVCEEPSVIPFGTLLLSIYGDGSIVAVWSGSRTGVSPEQALELLTIARGQEAEEKPVSEIKIGDKVRVVQIIVKDNDFVFTDERVTYLGRVGEVVEVIPGYACPFFVLFPGTKHLKGNFYNKELKVLSAPCESRENPETIRQLRKQGERLLKRLSACQTANERLATKATELEKVIGVLHRQCHTVCGWKKRCLKAEQANVRLRKENRRTKRSPWATHEVTSEAERNLYRVNKRIIEENKRLYEQLAEQRAYAGRLLKRGKELRKEHDDTLQVNESISHKLITIANEELHVSQGW